MTIKNGNQNRATCQTKPVDNDLVGIRKSKVTLKLDKPAYVGMCVLDLSKVSIYKFHFDYIKKLYK